MKEKKKNRKTNQQIKKSRIGICHSLVDMSQSLIEIKKISPIMKSNNRIINHLRGRKRKRRRKRRRKRNQRKEKKGKERKRRRERKRKEKKKEKEGKERKRRIEKNRKKNGKEKEKRTNTENLFEKQIVKQSH